MDKETELYELSVEDIKRDIREYELRTLVDEKKIGDGLTLSVINEDYDDRVTLYVTKSDNGETYSGKTSFSKEEFLRFTQVQFDMLVGETIYYAQPIDFDSYYESEYTGEYA